MGISIHAPRVGSDRCAPKRRVIKSNFNPRSPCGERRCCTLPRGLVPFISIHAPRVGSDVPSLTAATSESISIHAPRVGSDYDNASTPYCFLNFNPRSPCGERLCSALELLLLSYFNPRSPCGERRFNSTGKFTTKTDFNPRSPCGERHKVLCQKCKDLPISIHAPRVGSDYYEALARGGSRYISIHAPRVGSDQAIDTYRCQSAQFQSTLPVWGATTLPETGGEAVPISIHAPRVGSDYSSHFV